MCPVRQILDPVSDKWSMLVLSGLRARAMRFSDIKRGIPDISQRMLTVTLRKLERDGYLTRQVTETVPVRVTYQLTDEGTALSGLFGTLTDWAEKQRERVSGSRAAYDSLLQDAAE